MNLGRLMMSCRFGALALRVLTRLGVLAISELDPTKRYVLFYDPISIDADLLKLSVLMKSVPIARKPPLRNLEASICLHAEDDLGHTANYWRDRAREAERKIFERKKSDEVFSQYASEIFGVQHTRIHESLIDDWDID